MKIFDLEQDIMNCWTVIDDVKCAVEHFSENEKFKGFTSEQLDDIMNLLLGIQHVYDMRFQKLWNTFEAHSKEHHSLRRRQNDHDYNEQT